MAEGGSGTPRGSAGPLPRHVTTPLLSLVTEQALEEDYRRAAERRADAGVRPGPSRRAGVPALAAVAVLGLLLAVAAVETSADRGAREQGRASLVAEARSRRDLLADQQTRLAELRDANLAESAALTDLAERQESVDDRLRRLRTITGYGAVRGPGIRVDVDEPPGGDPADDMTLLLDGLWNAGAEGIAVDGRRITALTRVASTGPAVSLDGRSLVPPYELDVVGDPDTLQARFAESSSGAAFTALADTLLFGFEITGVEEVELPAATAPSGLTARPLLAPDDDLPERSGS
ncbi:hypothetical protein GCM10009737_13050 [Nocardioides lentus]|uniref:DUF881 domain-containing protein n=1 Tax=Nocardioides lentus TaxID=338077 RepID=A0ABN2P5Z1_9ACTN